MIFSKRKAIYTQISDHLCDEILKNICLLGEKFSSIRDMAVALEVNPNTVVRSYAALEQDGIIEMKRGIGYFVSSTAKEKFLNSKKEAFLKEELPCVFKTMDLLKIDFDEINQLYKKRKESA